jgi:predicted nucleotidyltransferase
MGQEEAVRLICEAVPQVVAIYRFGSTVEGTTHRDSDVDLALLARAPLESARRFELQERLALALRCNVDLVDLRAASTVMRMQVISTGEVMAVLDRAETERFETYVYSSYARLNEERKAILEQVLREGTVHGR